MTSRFGLFLAVVVAVSALACSDDSASMSPSGPSAVGSGQTEGVSGGVIEVEGDVASLAGSCPAVRFRLGSQVVRTSASTIFEHITCSGLKNGLELEVYGRMQTDGSLMATGIQPEYY